MGSTQTQHFRCWRIHSLTRPNNEVGLRGGFGRFTSAQLEALTAEQIGFYADWELLEYRGDATNDEEFVLQAASTLDGPWVNIKSIAPLPGENPEEPYFGDCMRCGDALEESEYAIGDTCYGCMPAVREQHRSRQESRAAEAELRKQFPGDFM